MMRLLIFGVCLGSLAAAFLSQAQADQGKELFQKKMCGVCHAAGKKGGDLKDSKMDKATMTKFLKDPKSVNPKAAMPAFKGSDAELAAVVDHVMSLRK